MSDDGRCYSSIRAASATQAPQSHKQ